MGDKKSQEELIGFEAQQVLDSKVHQLAMVAIEAKILKDFKNTKFFQKRHREEAWRKLQTLEWFKQVYEEMVRNGRKAQNDRESQNRQKHLRGL